MKIFHIIYDTVGNPWLSGGGAERTQEIYRRIGGRHEVTILCGNYPGAPREIDGVTYRRIGLTANYYASRLSFVLLAPWYILAVKADLFIEDVGMPTPFWVTGLKPNNYCCIQYIPNASYIEKRGLLGRILMTTFRVGLRAYRRFITVSPYAAEELRRLRPGADITVIPNGINLPATVQEGGDYILYLGRIDLHQKGINTLLDALKILKDRAIPFRMVIAGNGEKDQLATMEQTLHDYDLENSVEYRGLVTGDAKATTLAGASFLVFPSRNETFGIVAMEAFAYGKALVGSDTGGLADLMKQSGGGIMVEPGNAPALADAMASLLANPPTAVELGRRGRKFATTLTWDEIAQQHDALVKGSRQ